MKSTTQYDKTLNYISKEDSVSIKYLTLWRCFNKLQDLFEGHFHVDVDTGTYLFDDTAFVYFQQIARLKKQKKNLPAIRRILEDARKANEYTPDKQVEKSMKSPNTLPENDMKKGFDSPEIGHENGMKSPNEKVESTFQPGISVREHVASIERLCNEKMAVQSKLQEEKAALVEKHSVEKERLQREHNSEKERLSNDFIAISNQFRQLENGVRLLCDGKNIDVANEEKKKRLALYKELEELEGKWFSKKKRSAIRKKLEAIG